MRFRFEDGILFVGLADWYLCFLQKGCSSCMESGGCCGGPLVTKSARNFFRYAGWSRSAYRSNRSSFFCCTPSNSTTFTVRSASWAVQVICTSSNGTHPFFST